MPARTFRILQQRRPEHLQRELVSRLQERSVCHHFEVTLEGLPIVEATPAPTESINGTTAALLAAPKMY